MNCKYHWPSLQCYCFKLYILAHLCASVYMYVCEHVRMRAHTHNLPSGLVIHHLADPSSSLSPLSPLTHSHLLCSVFSDPQTLHTTTPQTFLTTLSSASNALPSYPRGLCSREPQAFPHCFLRDTPSHRTPNAAGHTCPFSPLLCVVPNSSPSLHTVLTSCQQVKQRNRLYHIVFTSCLTPLKRKLLQMRVFCLFCY